MVFLHHKTRRVLSMSSLACSEDAWDFDDWTTPLTKSGIESTRPGPSILKRPSAEAQGSSEANWPPRPRCHVRFSNDVDVKVIRPADGAVTYKTADFWRASDQKKAKNQKLQVIQDRPDLLYRELDDAASFDREHACHRRQRSDGTKPTQRFHTEYLLLDFGDNRDVVVSRTSYERFQRRMRKKGITSPAQFAEPMRSEWYQDLAFKDKKNLGLFGEPKEIKVEY